MHKKTRFIVIKAILIGTFFAQTIGLQAASKPPQIELNQQVQRQISPVIEKGTTLLPLRSISTLLGATVSWDGPSKTITIVRGDVTNSLTINENLAYREDKGGRTKIQLPVPPMIREGITYVPLRYIAESLDVGVNWDSENRRVQMNEALLYKNEKIFLGQDRQELVNRLGQPSFTMADELCEHLFYVDDYKNALILHSRNGIIGGFTTTAETMKFRHIGYASKNVEPISGLTTIKDTHDQDKIVGMGYHINHLASNSDQGLLVNERIIFELTNAFRAHNDIKPLSYNSRLGDVARQHSKDMAVKDYFSHTSIDGTSMSERINRAGIPWSSCGENIAAGNQTGLAVFGQWMNSWGHRKNMLDQSGDLGVGSAYDSQSSYRYYHTQNFAQLR